MSRPNGLAVVVLWLVAATFIVAGIACTLQPLPVAEILGMSLLTPSAVIDFVATYGGLELGWGVFLAMCARRADRVGVGLLAAGCGLAGFGLTRVYALFTTAGSPTPMIYAFLVLELSGAALSFWLAGTAAGTRRS